jgi:hypothetical protein
MTEALPLTFSAEINITDFKTFVDPQ